MGLFCRKLALAFHLLFLHAAQCALLYYITNDIAQVAAREKCEQGNHNDAANAANTGFRAGAHATAVFYIVAFASTV